MTDLVRVKSGSACSSQSWLFSGNYLRVQDISNACICTSIAIKNIKVLTVVIPDDHLILTHTVHRMRFKNVEFSTERYCIPLRAIKLQLKQNHVVAALPRLILWDSGLVSPIRGTTKLSEPAQPHRNAVSSFHDLHHLQLISHRCFASSDVFYHIYLSMSPSGALKPRSSFSRSRKG